MIEVNNLSVGYKTKHDEFPALSNLNFKLDKGQICAVIGPSGCGKSTLLHVLSGIIPHYKGDVLFDGSPINPRRHRIGFIPQNYGLLEWASVYENVLLGLKIKHSAPENEKSNIDYILEQLGLQELRFKYPGQLSGGQRQRVSIARSFVLKPDILLMDEPFSALDAITREETQELFFKVWKANTVTTVFVTHSIEEAVFIGKVIAVMSRSPGRITTILENPLSGLDDLRFSDVYYRYCVNLRKIVQEEWMK